MDLQLNGRRALVTASSAGIGFAVAQVLAEEGCRVAITGRDRGRLEAARGSLPAERVLALSGDLAQVEDVLRWSEQIEAAWQGVDILVLNSGGPPVGRFEQFGPEEWLSAFRAMVLPMVTLIQAFLPGMRAQRWGRIVVLTSTWVKQPPREGGVLSVAMRSALAGLAKQLAWEVAGEGVLVNHVMPGPTWTDRSRLILERQAALRGAPAEEVKRATLADVPLGRYAEPREIAQVVAVLCSEAASFVTGATVPVDGGQVRSLL